MTGGAGVVRVKHAAQLVVLGGPCSLSAVNPRSRYLKLAAVVIVPGVAALLYNCIHDTRDLGAARSAPTAYPSGLLARSWGLCSLIGPNNKSPGIYGTDLGFTARGPHDDKLIMQFGDTWVKPVDACQYPSTVSDDFQASLPVARPAAFHAGEPKPSAATSCNLLEYPLDKPEDPSSWPRLRLFPSPQQHDAKDVLDTSMLRTPAAAFSDGEHMFSIYYRHDPAYCEHSSECPAEMHCTTETPKIKLGQCATLLKLSEDTAPDYCRDAQDCLGGAACKPLERGVCLADKPFSVQIGRDSVVPTWYRDDPRRAIARTMYIATSVWPDRPSDYATVVRFASNRFQNIAVRTVAHFEADHPEHNDYRPGYHTLLVWGRASFAEYGGAQALPFFFYVPLAELRTEPEAMRWTPRYFAGYGDRGKPRWSMREAEAQPVYGTEANLVDAGGEKIAWREPEFDYVEWAGMSYIAPLKRWVMLYGGDVPAFLVLDPKTGRTREPVNLQFAPGAIHMRSAEHPWGRQHKSDAAGWSSAEPILTRPMLAHYLACGAHGAEGLQGCVKDGDPHSPLDLVATLAGFATRSSPGKFADVASSCVMGEFAYGVQNALSGDLVGRLYAPNIIDDWTEDVTPPSRAKTGPHSVEIYWNVSTWNPYQVVLVKSRIDETQIRADRD